MLVTLTFSNSISMYKCILLLCISTSLITKPVHTQTVQNSVSFSTYELQPVGTVVGQIPTLANVQYRLLQSSTLFTVDANSGVITTIQSININSLPSNPLTLFVVSVPSGRQIVTVTITVLDVNNNAPQFPHPSIQVLFTDTDPPGTQLIIDTATDADTGVDGTIANYSIASGNVNGLFKLFLFTDGTTSLLYLENTRALNTPGSPSVYNLNISAMDGGQPPLFGYEGVQVIVQRSAPNSPVFDHSQYSALISQTAPWGSPIVQVKN